ncbi:oxidative stress-responsive serine-rich protein 1 isoform 1-T3 [Pholidichthys leucotaenia]
MEAGRKDCEEETLEMAFKKLRVDAESLPGAVNASEALCPRGASRVTVDSSGAKSKLSCQKDNWHGCTRKTSRGASRTQRRRRSKSPIVHPQKFTYCSAAAAQKEIPSSSGTPGHIPPLVFGYEAHGAGAASSPSLKEIPTVITPTKQEEGQQAGNVRLNPEKSASDGAEPEAEPQRSGPGEATDFRSLSELSSSSSAEAQHTPCSCTQRGASESPEESGLGAETLCQCQSGHGGWRGMEVYCFTGLRNVISECENSSVGQRGAPRTLNTDSPAPSSSQAPPPSSGSPRSCSEQARSFVDDITIEDLSGYMEYYLYIPKKMSHMAEMMYT